MNLFASNYFSQTHQILIILHVLAALVSLVMAPLAMWVHKGGYWHRQWGKVYFWGMTVANLSAIILLFYRFNLFLLGVTILSFYGALTGYRVLYRKREGGNWFDWGIALIATACALSLIGWAVVGLVTGDFLGIPHGTAVPSILIIFPIIFGGLILQGSITDIRLFLTPNTDRNWWWYYHMDRMLGSYIGLFTALMVQQVGPRLPEQIAWVVWIAPAVIGGVWSNWLIKQYRQKFSGQVQKA